MAMGQGMPCPYLWQNSCPTSRAPAFARMIDVSSDCVIQSNKTSASSGRSFPSHLKEDTPMRRRPASVATYGALPPLGELDQYATQRGLDDLFFTPVGYGLQEV